METAADPLHGSNPRPKVEAVEKARDGTTSTEGPEKKPQGFRDQDEGFVRRREQPVSSRLARSGKELGGAKSRTIVKKSFNPHVGIHLKIEITRQEKKVRGNHHGDPDTFTGSKLTNCRQVGSLLGLGHSWAELLASRIKAMTGHENIAKGSLPTRCRARVITKRDSRTTADEGMESVRMGGYNGQPILGKKERELDRGIKRRIIKRLNSDWATSHIEVGVRTKYWGLVAKDRALCVKANQLRINYIIFNKGKLLVTIQRGHGFG